jgi:hypothetical protein
MYHIYYNVINLTHKYCNKFATFNINVTYSQHYKLIKQIIMSEFKGTRGGIENNGGDNASIDIILSNNATISICRYDRYSTELVGTREEMESNANLIVDAFKVRQQINCELSELLEQRNEMLVLLSRCQDVINHYVNGHKLTLEIEQLIKKVKDNE